uniref:Uncharacterized protein n=1 Tax=Arundo donax TaxID=35708 RepID=A0A0A9HNG0_ARUDO
MRKPDFWFFQFAKG